MRNVNTGAFEVYDVANKAAALGQVGLDWQLGGFAPDPPTGSMGRSVLGANLNCSESGRPALTFRLYRRPADGPTVPEPLSDRGAVRTGRRVTPSLREC